MFEYKTLMVTCSPDGLLNREATSGWECYGGFSGGFDVKGRHYPLSMTLLLRRVRVVEDEPAAQVLRAAAGAKGGKSRAL